MGHFKTLQIKFDYISIFASGLSIDNISLEEIHKIKEKSFAIWLNYAPIRYTKNEIDLLFWSDKKVCEWIGNFYKNKQKDFLWCTRNLAFNRNEPKEIEKKIDYWFNNNTDVLRGNYTIIWLLQLLKMKQFENKKILLFGVDMNAKDGKNCKWYDKDLAEKSGSYDFRKRGINYPFRRKLIQCQKQFQQFIDKKNVFNCNLNSSLNYFQKKDWKEILK